MKKFILILDTIVKGHKKVYDSYEDAIEAAAQYYLNNDGNIGKLSIIQMDMFTGDNIVMSGITLKEQTN